jgi:hypothetical protein
MFSPDGRWIAYTSSDGSGRTIFVQEMSATGIKHPIAKGAWHPLWSADGGELFYRTPGTRQEVVRITTKPSFGVSNPEAVPTGFTRARGSTERDYDIMPDGKRFIGVVAAGQAPSLGRAAVETRINVVLNWLEELKQRVPTR